MPALQKFLQNLIATKGFYKIGEILGRELVIRRKGVVSLAEFGPGSELTVKQNLKKRRFDQNFARSHLLQHFVGCVL